MCVFVFVSADDISHTTMCVKYEFLGDFNESFCIQFYLKSQKITKKLCKDPQSSCMDLESNSHATHKTLTTVNYVLNNCYRKK